MAACCPEPPVVLTHPPWTKWPPFRKRHFQMNFLEWKFLCFDSNFTEVCCQGSNRQYVSIGLSNGLAPNRRQAITWTNADPVHWSIYAALGGDELRLWLPSSWQVLTWKSIPHCGLLVRKIYRSPVDYLSQRTSDVELWCLINCQSKQILNSRVTG